MKPTALERLIPGFSLVEIVFAIGIISFSLVAIMGLVSLGLNSNKQSLDESLLAAMSRQVIGSLRQQCSADSDTFTTLSATTPTVVCFFDANGQRMQTDGKDLDQTSAIAKHAAYQCTMTVTSGTARLGPSPASQVVTPCLLDITMTFQWPPGMKNTNSHRLSTSIARYR